MNYLAHAWLSGENKDLLLGNMMGDFIKGKGYLKYPVDIQKGMVFHRHIDTYTDSHQSVKNAIKVFRSNGISYGGVFVDILFDHFFANDEKYFPSEESLKVYTEDVLNTLNEGQEFFSDQMKIYFGYMIRYNWLYHYKFKEGIEKAIMGIIKRHPRLGNAEDILFCMFNNYDELKLHYHQFFPDLQAWASAELGAE